MPDPRQPRVVRYENSRARAMGRPRNTIPGEGAMGAFRRALAGIPIPEEHKWKRIGMRVPPEWWKDVDSIVQTTYGASRASVLRAALWHYLDEHVPEAIAETDEELRDLEKIEQLRDTRGRGKEEAKTYREKANTLEAKLVQRIRQREEGE